MSYFPGDTVTLTLRDLTHSQTGPVTSGAVVTFALYDRSGTQVGDAMTATATNDDWSYALNLPTVHGRYELKAVAVVNGSEQVTKVIEILVRPVST